MHVETDAPLVNIVMLEGVHATVRPVEGDDASESVTLPVRPL